MGITGLTRGFGMNPGGDRTIPFFSWCILPSVLKARIPK